MDVHHVNVGYEDDEGEGGEIKLEERRAPPDFYWRASIQERLIGSGH